jgi:GPH family glycoside/pentoside/hexuronide:cation symporter
MVKFGMAFAGGMSGLIMSLVGFVPDAPVQAAGAVTGLRVAYSVVPIIGTLLAVAVIWSYDITEQRANEIRAELDRRREAASGATAGLSHGSTGGPAPATVPVADGDRVAAARLAGTD